MDPIKTVAEATDALRLAAEAAERYLASLDELPARGPSADAAAAAFAGALPEEGAGALEPLRRLATDGIAAATNSAGPRFFHFVIGGVTPAALGADWIAAAIDQNAGLWQSSQFASRLERLVVEWLRDLFELPQGWGGILTPSATYANFAALAAARCWWAKRHGVVIDRSGWAGLPPMPVLSGGYVHMSVRKSLGMLGVGTDAVQVFARDAAGRVDLEGMEGALAGLGGAPAVIVGNAGEVNAGDFDPIDGLADLAERYDAWLHIDGAFGLFARLSPRARALTDGVERAHSVISDGHKWLNVAYDSGFCFVRDIGTLAEAFGATSGPYIPPFDPERPSYFFLGPDSSRRARALPIWASLAAYGRSGYREMVERHLGLAQHLARAVSDAPDLELLAQPSLNIVCFRYAPPGADPATLDDLNRTLGADVLEDGRVYVGTTTYEGCVAFRPAIVNFRTTEREIDELVSVVRELGARRASGAAP